MLTLKDILKIQPELFEIAQGHSSLEIREESEKFKRKKYSGEFKFSACEECGKEALVENIDGKLMCQDCIEEM